MDADEACEVLSDFLRLKLEHVGRKVNSVANPIYEINKRHRSANPGRVDLVPDDVVASRVTPAEARVLKFIQHTSRWVPANPSNETTVAKVKSAYVGVSNLEEGRSTLGSTPNIANLITNGSFAFDESINSVKYILLSGVRGVGKTAFMNYWLTQNTRSLEADKTTWFRIDATKVYAIWQQNKSADVRELFERYYLVHAMYVLLRYSGELKNRSDRTFSSITTNSFFREIVDRLKKEKPKVVEKCCDFYINAKKQAPVGSDESVDIVSRIVSQRPKETKGTLEEIKAATARDFETQGILTLAIVDGIDNIAWTKRNTFYQKTCDQFPLITKNIMRAFGPQCKMILAARPETIYEIRHISSDDTSPSGFNWQYNHDQLQEWRVIPPPAKEVLAKKPEAIENNTRDALKHILRGRVDPGLQVIERSLSQDNLLKFVFDNDLRAYLDNVVKVFFIRRSLLQRQHIPLAEFQRRIMQFVLLNGRPFFNSREQYIALEGKKSRANFRDRGMVFPNLFWWPIETTSSALHNWHGLAALRLLQLAQCKGTFTCGDLIYCARKIFNYDVEVLIEIMESLVAFGLVDIHTETAATDFDEQKLASLKLHHYNNRGYVTEKGKVYPALIFSRPDLMYFYALDTPQKYDLVVEDTRMIKSFFEFTSGNVEDQFFAAAIPTVATFLLHVFHFSGLENSKVRSRKSKENSEHKPCLNYFGGQQAVLDAIALPGNLKSTFLDWAGRGMSPSPTRTKKDANDIVESVIGVFRGYTLQ